MIVSLRRLSIGARPPVLQKQFWTYKRNIGKNRKSGIVLWSNSIKSTWKIAFFFFLSTKRILIGSFAQKAFSRCPPVLQKSFWTYERDIGKNRKSGIVLRSNSIKSTWNNCFFSSFPQKGCILIVSLRRLSIGDKAFNRFPPVLQKQFWTYKRDIGKNRKSGIVLWSNSIKEILEKNRKIVLWSNSIKPTWNNMFLFFVSTKRMHIDNRMLSIGAPQYSRSLFGPMKEILEKIENQGLFYGQIQSNWNKCFFSSFPQKGCILIVSLRRLSIGAPQYSRNNFGPIKEILEKNRKSGIVLWSNSISTEQKGCLLVVLHRRLSVGAPSTPEVFLDLWKRYWKKSKIRDCFMVKFNQINMEQMFLFFVSTKRMHIDSFAQKAFNRCPPVLQKQFWTYKRDVGKKSKIRDCFMVKFNQTNMKFYLSFLRFHKKDAYW